MSTLATIAISVFGAILVKEVDGWGPKLASRLFALALKRLPPDRRGRYQEEWASHLDEMPTAISKLAAALGFSIAAIRIRLLANGRSVTGRAQDAVMRVVDVSIGLVSIITFFPILVVLALAVRLESPGPIIFASKRVGKDGQPFSCYKFRTMTLAENGEPQMTRVGRFLRKSSFDELPQFFNILNGSMSAVGPRPITESQKDHYGEAIVHYEAVRPGITGLWQVSSPTQGTAQSRVELDSEYAKKRSLKLYLKVILLTIPAVLAVRISQIDDDQNDGDD